VKLSIHPSVPSSIFVKLSIHPSRHPYKFLTPEEEEDGRGGGRMAAEATTVAERPILLWSQSILSDF
jgi:hypothetical protein